MPENSFFDEQKKQSLVKTTIIAKYFDVWANVMINTQKRYPRRSQKIAYIDLFAGPGRYTDGTQSTPLMILTKAIENDDIRERLVTLFNDKDGENSRTLENVINQLPKIDTLKYLPKINNEEVGEEIVKMFEEMNLIPTLFFVDPWGYKGLSLRLINSVLKDWGCDCLFFFNYNRINMGLSNKLVKEHMNALFGKERADNLREELVTLNPYERELTIIEELCQAIKELSDNVDNYTLPFTFKNARGNRTSHHLIFVSKHFRGYEIMKGIMARESTSDTQGVPSFEYNPADFLPKQTLLFNLSRPLDDLKELLLKEYNGKTLTMLEIYWQHNVDKPFIKKNYKDILRKLFEDGIIEAENENGKPPRKGTFSDKIIVTFPKKRRMK